MKGLILAAGLGTRLRPITSLKPKPTIAVANRPLIHYAVQNLVDAGISDIGIVVSHDTIEHLKASLEGYPGATFTWIIQAPPRGLAHAVKVSRDFLGDDDFMMYLGDNLFEHGIRSFREAFRPDEGVNAVLALVPVEDPRQLGVAVVEDGRITELVEKPEVPPSNLAVAGVYVFDRTIHPIIENLEPGAKDEYQITDAIFGLIEQGGFVKPVQVEGWWKDTGKPEDILDANRLMLMKTGRAIDGSAEQSELTGDVVVAEGATVRNSTIFGPAIIGAGSVIENAYIGPFTTVGRDCTVSNSEVEYSVIGDHTSIRDIRERVRESLIGEHVTLAGSGERPGSHRLVIGDRSELLLTQD
ncbi:MAG TPA: glucose-1-phosphate thymidylyltransferase [Deinococcales bacterium]|nr:glucose-1-phosphate thymidylyltransferase [Deinococcales bacterium]